VILGPGSHERERLAVHKQADSTARSKQAQPAAGSRCVCAALLTSPRQLAVVGWA
jgi:hypothetical protein